MALRAFSVTSLLLYERCPRAFYFKYILGAKVPKPPAYAFGAEIHYIIELAHKRAPNNRVLFFKSAEGMGRYWWKHWSQVEELPSYTHGISWQYQGQQWKMRREGWTLLAGNGKTGKQLKRGYYEAITHPPFPVAVLAVELRLQLTIATGSWIVPFEAKIDQIWKTPEGIAIVDLTTARLKPVVKSLQTTAYFYCLDRLNKEDPKIKRLLGGPPTNYYIWHLREERLKPVRPEDQETLFHRLDRTIEGAIDGDFGPTHQDINCGWCEYSGLCGRGSNESFPAYGHAEIENYLPARPQKERRYQQGHFKGWLRGRQAKSGKLKKFPLG